MSSVSCLAELSHFLDYARILPTQYLLYVIVFSPPTGECLGVVMLYYYLYMVECRKMYLVAYIDVLSVLTLAIIIFYHYLDCILQS